MNVRHIYEDEGSVLLIHSLKQKKKQTPAPYGGQFSVTSVLLIHISAKCWNRDHHEKLSGTNSIIGTGHYGGNETIIGSGANSTSHNAAVKVGAFGAAGVAVVAAGLI